MVRSFKRWKELAVEFCDRCARVCSAACRADEIRERAIVKALRYGARL
jgi:hypothetical protein